MVLLNNSLKITTVVWDWNGTLLDDVDICIDSINQLLTMRNLPTLSTSNYRDIFGFPVKDYYGRIGFDFAKEPFEIPAQQFIDLYSSKFQNTTLHLGATKTLDFFRLNELRQFVLSASEEKHLKHALRHFGISSFFEGVYGLGHHYAHSKTEVGRLLIEENKLNVNETLLIGDTTHDFEVAQVLGLNCALVAMGHNSFNRLKPLGVPVYENLYELISKIGV